MSQTACAKKLTSLLKKLPVSSPPELPDAHDPVAVLVQSFLMWETTTDKALTAYAKIHEHVVDFNDLRVCMPHEIAEMIGVRYPRALDRCERLRAALRDVFLREHTVGLDSLGEMGKREVKKYIDTLDGVTPYVAGRVQLVCYEAHAIPADEQLRAALIAEGAADSGHTVAELSNWLARQIKAEDALAAHYAFQDWIDSGKAKTRGGKPTRKKKTTRRPGRDSRAKSSNKKSAARASS